MSFFSHHHHLATGTRLSLETIETDGNHPSLPFNTSFILKESLRQNRIKKGMRHTLFVVFLFPACVYLYIFRLRECHSFDCSGIAPGFFLGAVGPNRARRLICDAQRSILCHSCRWSFFSTQASFADRTFRLFVPYAPTPGSVLVYACEICSRSGVSYPNLH